MILSKTDTLQVLIALPYYEGPSRLTFTSQDSYEGQFTLTPRVQQVTGFNEVTYTYESEFLDVQANGLAFTVTKQDDYDWAGWVSTTILFDFPLAEVQTCHLKDMSFYQ